MQILFSGAGDVGRTRQRSQPWSGDGRRVAASFFKVFVWVVEAINCISENVILHHFFVLFLMSTPDIGVASEFYVVFLYFSVYRGIRQRRPLGSCLVGHKAY